MKKRKFRINVDPQSLVPVDSVRKYYLVSVILTILLVGIIAGVWRYLPYVVPLLFTEPWGIERLVPKLYLYFLPIISLIVIMTNILIGKMMNLEDHKILIQSLGVGTLAVTTTLAVSLLGIIQSIL